MNVQPVAQESSTTNDSESEKTLRSPAGQTDVTGEDGAGHDVREPTLENGSKMGRRWKTSPPGRILLS